MTFSENKRVVGMLILLLATIYLTSYSNHSNNNRSSTLAGMYKLCIMENQDSSGTWHEDQWAKGGDSYIVYDGLGHMAVQITPKGYKDFKWLTEVQSIDEKIVKEKIDTMSVAELKAALAEFASDYVYFANYSIDDTANVVTHNRISSSIPAIWNTQVKRKFSFSGDTLTLLILNGNRRLKWIRQK